MHVPDAQNITEDTLEQDYTEFKVNKNKASFILKKSDKLFKSLKHMTQAPKAIQDGLSSLGALDMTIHETDRDL